MGQIRGHRSGFLSTPSARRATTVKCAYANRGFISIHALREEGDTSIRAASSVISSISIHALREEGDTHDHRHCVRT